MEYNKRRADKSEKKTHALETKSTNTHRQTKKYFFVAEKILKKTALAQTSQEEPGTCERSILLTHDCILISFYAEHQLLGGFLN